MFYLNRSKRLVIGILILFFFKQVPSQTQLNTFQELFQEAIRYRNIDSDSAIIFAVKALNIANENNMWNNQLDALSLIIKTYIKKGNYSEAILKCLIADSIIAKNDLTDRSAEILMYKGIAFQAIGLQTEGLNYLIQSQQMTEETKNQSLFPELYYYLALSFYNVDNYEKCREYARSSIKEEKKIGNETATIKCYLLMANTFENPDSIQKYLQLADSHGKVVNNNYSRASIMNNKALFYKAMGNYTKSKSLYIAAIYLTDSNRLQELNSYLYNNFAYLLMDEKKFDSAKLLLDKALKISKKLKNIELEGVVLDSYSDFYLKVNDSARSFKYYKESVKLKNEFRIKQQTERSAFLSTVFETDKKEKQLTLKQNELNRLNIIVLGILLLLTISIAILIYTRQKLINRKTRLLALEKEKKLDVANALIEGQDVERKRLAMDLHDGVTPRIGMLRMAVENELKNSEHLVEIVHSFDDIIQEVREMSHKMLPTQLENKGLVFAIDNFIQLTKKNQEFDIKFYSNLTDRLQPKLEINLFFITYELINNAMKHANAQTIDVQLVRTQNAIMISVEDDGKGFNKNEEFDGHGLRNLRERVKFLDGIFEIESNIGEGTLINIEVAV